MAKYHELVLLEQKFILDDKMETSHFVKLRESNISSTVKLSNYKLLILGKLNQAAGVSVTDNKNLIN
jgi:elongation factor Ts